MSDSDEWLTKRQASEYLRVSVPTLDRWMRLGLVRFYKLDSGEYQLNVGPVGPEQKVFVCIMDTIVPTHTKTYSFYLNRPGAQ